MKNRAEWNHSFLGHLLAIIALGQILWTIMVHAFGDKVPLFLLSPRLLILALFRRTLPALEIGPPFLGLSLVWLLGCSVLISKKWSVWIYIIPESILSGLSLAFLAWVMISPGDPGLSRLEGLFHLPILLVFSVAPLGVAWRIHRLSRSRGK